MPAPATTVPAYSDHTWPPPRPRSTSPSSTRVMPPPTAAAVPTRRATWLATGASRPMQSTGKVVSTPIHALLSPRSALMLWASGGRLAISVRRLAATSTSAVTTTQVGAPCGWRGAAASGRVVVTATSIPERPMRGDVSQPPACAASTLAMTSRAYSSKLGPRGDGQHPLPLQLDRCRVGAGARRRLLRRHAARSGGRHRHADDDGRSPAPSRPPADPTRADRCRGPRRRRPDEVHGPPGGSALRERVSPRGAAPSLPASRACDTSGRRRRRAGPARR